MKIRESCLQSGTFIYKPGISVTKQDFHLQMGSLGLQMGFSGYYLPVKENAESVLAQLGIPMATAIDMYLKQISLVGGIPFSIVLPKAANSVNADMMSVTQIHQKLEKGYADIEKGNVEDAASAFVAFRERH